MHTACFFRSFDLIGPVVLLIMQLILLIIIIVKVEENMLKILLNLPIHPSVFLLLYNLTFCLQRLSFIKSSPFPVIERVTHSIKLRLLSLRHDGALMN